MAIYRTHAQGLVCAVCERVVSFALRQLPGVRSVRVRYLQGTVSVVYDETVCDSAAIDRALGDIGYPATSGRHPLGTTIAMAAAALGLCVLLQVIDLPHAPTAGKSASLSWLFVIGVITSIHCVAMCGGIMLAQTTGALERAAERSYGGVPTSKPSPEPPLNEARTRRAPHLRTRLSQWRRRLNSSQLRPALQYNGGRVAAYMAMGALMGAFGAPLAYSPLVKGIVLACAGGLVAAMGLRMMGLFPRVRPPFLTALERRLSSLATSGLTASHRPLAIGLATGLMPCGALAALWAYAAQTGSALAGALAMGAFGLGTAPALLLLGWFGAFMPPRHMKKLLAAGAIVMVALGLHLLTMGIMTAQ